MELHVAGTGSFALEVVDYARAAGHEVIGLVELVDSSRVGSENHGLPVVAAEDDAASLLGPHVLVGRGALVGHHVRIGAGATLNPGLYVAGNARVGEGATIGMGALVSNGLEVGAGAVVAAGAVVVRPVEPATRVQDVPARVFSHG